MNAIENLPLAQIVTLKSEAAIIFEKYHLDFCCRGKQSLSDAMKGNQEKLKIIKTELEQLFKENEKSAGINFEKIPLNELIQYIIQTHHQYVQDSIPVISEHVRKISGKHGERHTELKQIATLFGEASQELIQHMMKEELVLFPRIIMMETLKKNGDEINDLIHLKTPVNAMEAEHEQVGNMLAEIRRLSNDYTPPTDACITYKLTFEELRKFELDLHQHVHLENNILFPEAIAMQDKLNENALN